jgi:hypothetical protein
VFRIKRDQAIYAYSEMKKKVRANGQLTILNVMHRVVRLAYLVFSRLVTENRRLTKVSWASAILFTIIKAKMKR